MHDDLNRIADHFPAVQHGADGDADLGGIAKPGALAADWRICASTPDKLAFGGGQQLRAFGRKPAIAAKAIFDPTLLAAPLLLSAEVTRRDDLAPHHLSNWIKGGEGWPLGAAWR
jgi:hypothetical protein